VRRRSDARGYRELQKQQPDGIAWGDEAKLVHPFSPAESYPVPAGVRNLMGWIIVAHIFSTLVAMIGIGRLSASEKDLEILLLRHPDGTGV
jgi:hypothetical protein